MNEQEKMAMNVLRRLGTVSVVPVLLALAASVMPGVASSGTAAAATSHSTHYVQLSGHVEYADGTDDVGDTVYILPYGSRDSSAAYYGADYSVASYTTDSNGDFVTTSDYGGCDCTFRVNRRYTIEVDGTDEYGYAYQRYFDISVPAGARGIRAVGTLTLDLTFYY